MASPQPAPACVLLVEDDRELQEMFTLVLERILNVGVHVVTSNEDVERTAIASHPDLVIVDMGVSQSSRIVAQLKGSRRTRALPVIGVCSTDQLDRSAVLASGCDACFDDGDIGELESIVRKYLQRTGKSTPRS